MYTAPKLLAVSTGEGVSILEATYPNASDAGTPRIGRLTRDRSVRIRVSDCGVNTRVDVLDILKPKMVVRTRATHTVSIALCEHQKGPERNIHAASSTKPTVNCVSFPMVG